MADLPRAAGFDNSLGLLAEGYRFIGNRCEALKSDIFRTRLMLSDAICMKGAEAAEVFYTPGRFTRVGAMPATTLMSLQDRGSVQALDGAEHRQRKAMFMALMTPERRRRMTEEVEAQWLARLASWKGAGAIRLFPEVSEILGRAVCAWSQVPPLTNAEAKKLARELSAMIDGAGSFGPRNWRGLLLRLSCERWARHLFRRVRSGELTVPHDGALGLIASHRDADGNLLDDKIAAVELLNILRPTLAVDRFIVFAALALKDHPLWREKLAAGEDRDLEAFVQEVRRYYPFFPVIAGRVRQEFEWRGHRFRKGEWVLLDLYGTNRDARAWDSPEEFRPERFYAEGNITPYNLIPQGGGDYHEGHRCPGEWLTIDVMKTAVRLLTKSMTYDVPPQDLTINLARMPAIPKSRFIISNVRPVA